MALQLVVKMPVTLTPPPPGPRLCLGFWQLFSSREALEKGLADAKMVNVDELWYRNPDMTAYDVSDEEGMPPPPPWYQLVGWWGRTGGITFWSDEYSVATTGLVCPSGPKS